MTKMNNEATITRKEAKSIIWNLCDSFRGRLTSEEYCEVILELLLWAECIPTSKEDLIGYFDAMQSITDGSSWEQVKVFIDKECAREPYERTNKRKLTQEIEQLRSALLPLARTLISGTKEDRRSITEALLQTREELTTKQGYFDCSFSMGQLWKEVNRNNTKGQIACLFPMGVGATTYLSGDHQIFTHTENPSQQRWINGINKLMKNEIKPLNPEGGWSTVIACPPWGEKTKELITSDPWLAGAELQCPDSLRDLEARRIYAAHQLCTDKTYALASPSIGFSGLKDIEFFRQELVKNNWLDAIVELPNGCQLGTPLGGILLVLRHKRNTNTKIAIISGERLLPSGKSKAKSTELDSKALRELSTLLSKPVECDICTLVDGEEIKKNEYKFQVNRYLKSTDDAAIEGYLESRNTLRLGDIAEIKRPIASLGKKSETGIPLREATMGDICDSGLIEKGSKLIQIPEPVIAKGRDQLLEEGDILLSIKGSIGKIGIVGKLKQQTIPGQAFCVVRLRQNAPLSANALVQYLRCEIGQSLFQKRSQGTGVAFIPMGEVKSIPIIIPSEEENKRSNQLKARTSKLGFEIKRLTNELSEISRNGWLEDFTPTHQKVLP